MRPNIPPRVVIARQRTASILLGMLLLAAFASASAQTAQPSVPEGSAADRGWQQVEALSPGKKLSITTASRSHLHCTFASADDASLHCGNVSIARAEIRSVKMPHRARSAAIGFVAGLAVALLIEGAAINSSMGNADSVEVAIGAAFLGAAVVIALPILAVVYDFCEETIYVAR
jgi:hypothetical protein